MNTSSPMTLVDRWSESLRAAGPLPGPGWLQRLRERAVSEFSESGLPNRKTESWKYTPVRAFEKLEPPAFGSDRGVQAVVRPQALLDADCTMVDIANGVLAAPLPEAPNGVSILALAEGMQRYEIQLKRLIEKVDLEGSSNAFAALNTACLEQGLVVHVSENVHAGALLMRWASSAGGASQFQSFRVFLLLEAGAQLDFLEQYQSEETAEKGLNVIIQAELGHGAALGHIRVQSEPESMTLLTSTSIGQTADSRYSYRGFDLGGGMVRHEFEAELNGPRAFADFSGAFVLDNKRHVDNHVSVDHASPDCRSEQFFRGVLGGRSRGVFNGRALIRTGADGSSVRQSNANLLLSELAEMDTKPELEIYADEVEASHGATVGRLDEDAVFYLRTRGLGDDQARRMLTSAFCRAVTERIEDRALAAKVAEMVDSAMPGGLPGNSAGPKAES